MKLKAVWLTTLSLSTLVLVSAVPLNKAASQLWTSDVAHAAKVTASLLKGKQLHPFLAGRRSRVTPPSTQPSSAPMGQPQRPRNELSQRVSFAELPEIINSSFHRSSSL